jgi:uncharacterized protein (DUF952 family)
MILLHIVDRGAWARAGACYTPPSVASEGFVHLSHPHQIEATARRFYAESPALTVLVLDPSGLVEGLAEEDTSGHGVFPHHYGPIPRSAVLRTVVWSPVEGLGFCAPEAWL